MQFPLKGSPQKGFVCLRNIKQKKLCAVRSLDCFSWQKGMRYFIAFLAHFLFGHFEAKLRRRAASLALARRAMDPDHLLHNTNTREETQPRLKSRRPFATSGKDLSTTLPNETKAHWIARMWSVEWQLSTSRLREYITSPSRSSPGSDLPRQAWVKLNRLRTGVGRFNADMWRWGLSKRPAYDCGADQQTANHIITECPLYHPPNGLHGLIDVDADAATREWLLSKFPEI